MANTNLRRQISSKGMSQNDVALMLTDIMTTIEAICSKLDADSGVTDTNYNSLFARNGSSGSSLPNNLIDVTAQNRG
jgi:hypothetical protein